MDIYQRALKSATYIGNCTNLNTRTVDKLLENKTKANKRKVIKIALLANVIDEQQAKQELKNIYYNPYTHYKTKTHIIYCHSAIEYFIEVE